MRAIARRPTRSWPAGFRGRTPRRPSTLNGASSRSGGTRFRQRRRLRVLPDRRTDERARGRFRLASEGRQPRRDRLFGSGPTGRTGRGYTTAAVDALTLAAFAYLPDTREDHHPDGPGERRKCSRSTKARLHPRRRGCLPGHRYVRPHRQRLDLGAAPANLEPSCRASGSTLPLRVINLRDSDSDPHRQRATTSTCHLARYGSRAIGSHVQRSTRHSCVVLRRPAETPRRPNGFVRRSVAPDCDAETQEPMSRPSVAGGRAFLQDAWWVRSSSGPWSHSLPTTWLRFRARHGGDQRGGR